MSQLPALIAEIEASLGRSSRAVRARALPRLVELLVSVEAGLEPDGFDLLDQAMVQSAPLADLEGRIAAAERLGGRRTAPPGILRLLALDDAIVVAWPILSRSPVLDDQDLMLVATQKGAEHRLAICARANLSAMLTDVLVARDEREVRLALARNEGATLSASGAAALVDRAREDEALQDLMGMRTDLTPELAASLIDIVRDTVRRQLLAQMPGGGGGPAGNGAGAAPLPPPPPGERDLRLLAEARRSGEVERLFARLTGLPRALSHRLLTERANDMLLIVGKAKGWSWPTLRTLLALRDPSLVERHHFRPSQDTFESVATSTAERVLRFLAQPDLSRQARPKVR